FHRNDELHLYDQVTASRCLRSREQQKTAKEQPASTLFFRIYNRRWPRVSAENEMSLADILLQRTAKVHRSYELPLAPCILWMRHPAIGNAGSHLWRTRSSTS